MVDRMEGMPVRLDDLIDYVNARQPDGGALVHLSDEVLVSEHVGEVASREGVTLRELRLADRGGLEELFINLTREPDNGAASATTQTNELDLMEVTR